VQVLHPLILVLELLESFHDPLLLIKIFNPLLGHERRVLIPEQGVILLIFLILIVLLFPVEIGAIRLHELVLGDVVQEVGGLPHLIAGRRVTFVVLGQQVRARICPRLQSWPILQSSVLLQFLLVVLGMRNSGNG
jgi:hypothetical protein